MSLILGRPKSPYKSIHPSITSLTTPLSKIWLRQVVDIGEVNLTPLKKIFKIAYFSVQWCQNMYVHLTCLIFSRLHTLIRALVRRGIAYAAEAWFGVFIKPWNIKPSPRHRYQCDWSDSGSTCPPTEAPDTVGDSMEVESGSQSARCRAGAACPRVQFCVLCN